MTPACGLEGAIGTVASATPFGVISLCATPRGLGRWPAQNMTRSGSSLLCPRQILFLFGLLLNEFIRLGRDEVLGLALEETDSQVIDTHCRIDPLRHVQPKVYGQV